VVRTTRLDDDMVQPPVRRHEMPHTNQRRGTESSPAAAQAEVRALLDGRSEAVWTKDIDRLMSFYSPDIVYFDIVPGFQYTGSAALRPRFLEWFGAFEGPIGQEIHDLHVVASGDVAVAYMLIRASGTLKNGREVGYWVRATSAFQRSDHGWLVTHEHVSLPIDMESGRAAMDLAPYN
jgi:ketosteroid isomerase-like protein